MQRKMESTYVKTASVLIIEGYDMRTVVLDRPVMTIGRSDKSVSANISFGASIVSRNHGQFFFKDGCWYYRDTDSTNGTFIDGYHARHDSRSFLMQNGTTLRIDGGEYSPQYRQSGVLMYFCDGDFNQKWITKILEFGSENAILAGRDPACQLQLDTVTVSRRHGMFFKNAGKIFYRDMSSRNGTIINDVMVTGTVEIRPKDVILMGNVKMIYIDGVIMYTRPDTGGYLDIRGLTRIVNDSEHRGKKKVILDNVSASVSAGKLVAVLGTSGAGKTTFLNCVIGYEQATSGQVLINETDLYKNKKLMKKQIGYVPQEDLLRDNISLKNTLDYIGKLRLPTDVSKQERLQKIDSVLEMLNLDSSLKNSKIRKLSGGQRKRVSIASELISDPPLLFLDEPTSGLDPETETDLMYQLRDLSHNGGKTLVVITHTIQNIMLFDMVLFFGPGGKLCYAGGPGQAMAEFGVKEFADIYPKVRENPDKYAARCRAMMGVQ